MRLSISKKDIIILTKESILKIEKLVFFPFKEYIKIISQGYLEEKSKKSFLRIKDEILSIETHGNLKSTRIFTPKYEITNFSSFEIKYIKGKKPQISIFSSKDKKINFWDHDKLWK